MQFQEEITTMAEQNEQQTQQTTLSAFSDQLADLVASVARSIVTVAARPRQSATGILWNAGNETVVVTADHVVEREDDINITLPDGRAVKAQLAGRDPSTDIAVLRLAGVDLGTGSVAAETSDGVRVGSLVVAIGRPAQDGPRVSFGAVSAIDGPRRSWQGATIDGIIYPDVTLYPGFSGGPLVDFAGKVVGLNSSHLTRQNSTALPIATVRRVVGTIVQHGSVKRGYLGIGTQQIPLPVALAQKAGATQDTALLLVTVESGSPAEQAGLLVGDILIAMNGQTVTDVEGLRGQLASAPIGQALTLKTLRGGEPRDVSVTPGERA